MSKQCVVKWFTLLSIDKLHDVLFCIDFRAVNYSSRAIKIAACSFSVIKIT